ncbi:GMC oxidoreductase [Zopfia rhizophila CBS 207.26]|uniref:GMC oxidoreductase n=1 Tax=Zopfia rhizophila CBS 207.26 TaxID=1314779 RepID=A0A6A6E398_9PEZI|nr:GMC oxidoreductase [Zopfia rhizophila CBS 207.26]
MLFDNLWSIALLSLFAFSSVSHSQINATQLDTYDYIIVGSGPGGGPLSARLAIAGFKVLLIEAGDDQGSAIEYQVPAVHAISTEYEPMRWDYYVNHYSDLERQKRDSKLTWRTPDGDLFVGPSAALGTGEPPAGSSPLGVLYPRAGTLGGCSAHNALITIYPHKSDWEYLASLTGDISWGAGNMRKYFQKLEKSEYLPNGIVGHGFNGWLRTAVTDLILVLQDFKLLSLVIAAATAMGRSILALITTLTGLAQVLLLDINADTPARDSTEGLYQVPLSMNSYHRNGAREFILDTANAKNGDGSKRYHLDILMNTLVTKVNFDTSTTPPTATSVDFLQGKSLYRADPRAGDSSETPGTVNASKEIILAAGSFNTPQLLKLSGIGPAAELEKHSIPLIHDAPGVGTNLQDRYEASLGGKTDSDFSLIKDCTFLKSSPDPCLEKWTTAPNGLKGVYGSNGLAIGLVKKSSTAEKDPDLFIAGAPAYFFGYFPGYSDFALADKKHWVWVVLKAHSRNNAGTVELRSNDPRDTPVINFNSFDAGVTSNEADKKDLQAVYEGMQLSRRIFDRLIPLDGDFEEVWPGANTRTEAQMKEFIKNEAWGHHACCTAPIGREGDRMAVLDERFRVRGVKRLRVVDASAFPKIPGFYIAVPVYMISEKAADVIVEDARRGG